jgi:tetratricopeptide (TPR) repeat protein
MDHPNIARIYDGGVTPSGQPFFVMELIEGVPLTEYCDHKRMSVPARLELMVSVCQAVQHAHQKGIIHRDLKPSNVLVTEVDGRPTPKVIDFGVAKATELKLTDMSFADAGAIVGTPAYMSPEQADPTSMDIDTRTDVYALGVMLYELLTGSPPIDVRRFKRGAILEMLRMVREVEPSRPSTKLSTADDMPTIAANRSIEPAKLSKSLRGELDWVVMKALEKDRNRRYETANGLAQDIQRFLSDDVVEARPPSSIYRLSKLIRRNKGRVLAFSLVLLALIGGIIGTTIGMIQANKATEAQRLATLQAQEQTKIADGRLDQRNRALDLLTGAFHDLDPKSEAKQGKPLRALLGERLERASQELLGNAVGDPLDVAVLQQLLGEAQYGLGHSAWAEPLLTRAAETFEAELGPEDAKTLRVQEALAGALRALDRTDEAMSLLERILQKKIQSLGKEDPSTVSTRGNLAASYWTLGKFEKSIPLFESVLQSQKTLLGLDHSSTLKTQSNLGMNYAAAGKPEEGIRLLTDCLKRWEATVGPESPNTLETMNNLAVAYWSLGKLDRSVPLFEDLVKREQARSGPDHPTTLKAMMNLGVNYRDSGRLPEAINILERVTSRYEIVQGPDHQDTLFSQNALAATYWNLHKLDKSIPLFEKTLEKQRIKFGNDHPHTLLTMANLGINYWSSGRRELGLARIEEAWKHIQARPGPVPADLRWIPSNLVMMYAEMNLHEKAEPLLRDFLDQTRIRFGANHLETGSAAATLGLNLLKQNKFKEAEPILRECLVIRQKSQPSVWTTFNTQSMLGGALLGQKKFTEAEPLLLQGYEGMKNRDRTIPPQATVRLLEAVDRLIDLYKVQEKPEDVKKWKSERAKFAPKEPDQSTSDR